MGTSLAAPLSLAATGLSAFGKIDAGNTAAQNAYGQAANAQEQAATTSAYDKYQAKFLSNAAEIGSTAAAQTDADMQMQLAGKVATIKSIRGASGTESGTTDAAIANRTTEVSDINRGQTVANIQAQNAQDTLASSYYRSAGISALQIGQMQADQDMANAQADETSGLLGAGSTGLSALSGLAGNKELPVLHRGELTMPDLIPGAPDVVAQAPQNKVGAGAFERAPAFVPEQSLAAGLEQFGSGLEDLAVPLAKQEGAQAGAASGEQAAQLAASGKGVALDANGMPQVMTAANSFILGHAGEAYTAAADAGVEAKVASTISQKLTDLRVANEGNPQAFTVAATSFADYWRKTYPGQVGNDLANQVHNEAAQHYASLEQQSAALSIQKDKSALLTQISDTQNKMQVLARGGGITTDAYAALQAQLATSYNKLGTNKLFGYGPERAASELDQALSMGRAEYTIGQVDATYNRSGKAAAFDMLNKGIALNQDLKIPITERDSLVKLAWRTSSI